MAQIILDPDKSLWKQCKQVNEPSAQLHSSGPFVGFFSVNKSLSRCSSQAASLYHPTMENRVYTTTR